MTDQEKYFESLIGKRVIVIWSNPIHDWIAFRLIWEDGLHVKLKGVSSPDGSTHDGSCFICKTSEIRDIIEWKE